MLDKIVSSNICRDLEEFYFYLDSVGASVYVIERVIEKSELEIFVIKFSDKVLNYSWIKRRLKEDLGIKKFIYHEISLKTDKIIRLFC